MVLTPTPLGPGFPDAGFDVYRQGVRTVAEQEHVVLVDTVPFFSQGSAYWFDGIHLTALGNAAMIAGIACRILVTG
jgi:lysophospholipase L1-like esterase